MNWKLKEKVQYFIKRACRINLNCILDIFKFLFFFPISICIRKKMKKEHIWLISENPIQANDNGWALLKYIKENRPNINVYYIIDKRSKDIEKVGSISNIIIDKSFKHWIYYFNAEVILVTQKYSNPSPMIFYFLHKYKLIKGKRVFLQHGIIKDRIPCYFYNSCKFDLFICGAKREYEYVKESFGYPQNNVVYTGLARFDLYNNITKKYTERFILIAPTWRNWINLKNADNFFDNWNCLLNNAKLNQFLEEKNINIKFVLHQELSNFKDNVNVSNKRIKIYRNCEINYSEILSECLMLITDYSSIFFDIAYLNKPVIYYQFDIQKYRSRHLSQGYYSYEKDGFGIIYNKANDVVNKVIEYENCNFKIEEKYKVRAENFFERRDSNNCKRIVQAIYNIIK